MARKTVSKGVVKILKQVIQENQGYPNWTRKQIQQSLLRQFPGIFVEDIDQALVECADEWNGGK